VAALEAPPVSKFYFCGHCKRRHRYSSKIGAAHLFHARFGPGVHTMSAETYHADPCETPSLSASIAQILCSRSPWHAWAAHPRLNPDFARKDEKKFDIGTAAHAMLLEPDGNAIAIVVADNYQTKAARASRDEVYASGRIPLLPKQLDEVVAMVAAARKQIAEFPVDPPLFSDGKAEQTLIWQEPGVTCRARVDWLRDDFRTIDDFKTTSASAHPASWTRTLLQIGADVQTAFYLRGLARIARADNIVRELRYVVQEVYPPYALSVISLGPDLQAIGNDKVAYALKLWAKCLEADHWPGYPTRVAYAEAPGWADTDWYERREAQAA
jgi:PDDEXK-like domain of unknown function (DUF3799)